MRKMLETLHSQYLSNRTSQPGNFKHRTNWEKPEENFVSIVQNILIEEKLCDIFSVEEKPKEDKLKKLYGVNSQTQRNLSLNPDAVITNLENGKKMFFEIKFQKDGGNAEERCYKYFTSKFIQIIHQIYRFPYHPFKLIFCGNLATDSRYIQKFSRHLNDEDFFLWINYETTNLRKFIVENVLTIML